jgi:putative transposase
MTVSSKRFFKIQVGDDVTDGKKAYRVTRLVSIDKVLAINLADQSKEMLSIGPLQRVQSNTEQESKQADRDLTHITAKEQTEIDKRLAALSDLDAFSNPSRVDMEKIAQAHGIHITTLFRWRKIHRQNGFASALIPAKRGRKWGNLRIQDDVEKIMQSVIEDTYLHKQRPTVQTVVEELMRRCRLAHVVPPHPNTLRNRIHRISEETRLKKRGQGDLARTRFKPITGAFPNAHLPFDVVQIDHTDLDIITVDEKYRKPVGRPHITLATDVYSRMVVGFYVSYDRPDAAAVGICLTQAMCPKEELLAKLDVKGDWPVWGQIGTVHCDNAKEFRGGALQRGCQEHLINLAFRPPGLPEYGGNVESLMRLLGNEIHKIPGTTFSNPVARKGYDSEGEASLTLSELEKYLAEFFVNVYHQRTHGQLGTSPLNKWRLGLLGDGDQAGLGIMPKPENPKRILLDFLPSVERSIQRYGVHIDLITYYDRVLDRYINSFESDNKKSKRMFTFRIDPRDMSRVYFFDPEQKDYFPIPYQNRSHPSMSLTEYKEVRERLKQMGHSSPNEHLIFDALDKLHKSIEEGRQKTKVARRQHARSAASHAARGQPLSPVSSRPTAGSFGGDTATLNSFPAPPQTLLNNKVDDSDSLPDFTIEDL